MQAQILNNPSLIADAYLQADPDGSILYVSPALHSQLPAPETGGNIFKMFPKEAVSLKEAFSKVLCEKSILSIPFTGFRGEFRFCTILPLADAVILHFHEKNSSTAPGDTLDEKITSLNTLAASLPDMVAVIKLADRELLYTNEKSFEAAGFNPARLRNMNPEVRPKSFIHPDDYEGYLEYFGALRRLNESDTISFEYRAKSEHGEWQWYLCRGRVFQTDDNGVPTHCLNVVQNITARKQMEESLSQHNATLQDKNEELAAFAFIASHDLKEPLRKINTFSSWLLDKEGDHLSEQGKQYLLRMQNSVSRMDLLISDVLTLLRLQEKQTDYEDVVLETILKKVKEDLDTQITESGAQIYSNKLPVIKGFANSYYFLFLNIIGNAIKFRKKGTIPVIRLSAREVLGSESGFATAVPGQRYLELQFADNGIGFEEKYSKMIFQMFQRLHGKAEYAGTGIGLAICKKIMDNHDGFIRAESRPGEGATFFAAFPII